MTLLGRDPQTTRKAIRNLLFINVYIIALDCTLIGLCYSAHFLLQGFYKPAVYAIKLRTEFSILNQLRASLMGSQDYGSGNSVRRESAPRPIQFSATRASRCFGSDDCDLETDKTGDTKEIKPGVIYKTTTTTVKTSEDGSRHVMVQTVVE